MQWANGVGWAKLGSGWAVHVLRVSPRVAALGLLGAWSTPRPPRPASGDGAAAQVMYCPLSCGPRARAAAAPRAPKRRTRCDSGCPRLAKTHAKNRLNTRLRRRSASAAALAAAGPSTGSTDLLRVGGCRQRRHGAPCGRAALLAHEYAIRPHFIPTTYEASAPGDTDFGAGSYVARSGPSYRCRC